MVTQSNPRQIKMGQSVSLHNCTLEITGGGVIYVHDNEQGKTLLRICRLPTPIPNPKHGEMLDITHMHGTSFGGLTVDDRAELLGKIIAEEFRRDNWGDIDPNSFGEAFDDVSEGKEVENDNPRDVLIRVVNRLYELGGGNK